MSERDETPRGGMFGQIPTVAIFDKRISHAAFRVLAALSAYADEYYTCYPREAPIAHRLGITQSAVSHSLAQLVTLGYVRVMRYADEALGEKKARNHYTLNYSLDNVTGSGNMKSANISSPNISSAHVKNIPVYRTDQNRTRTFPRKRKGLNKENLAGASADATASPREPLVKAAAEHIPPPETASEKGRWGKAIKSLADAGATPAQITACCRAWPRVFPDAQLTITALEANWSLLKGKVNGTHRINSQVQPQSANPAQEAARMDDLKRWQAEYAALVGASDGGERADG